MQKNKLKLSQELLRLILPEFLVNHFDLYDYKQQGEKLALYFEERSGIPLEFSKDLVISHGFHQSITIQDFPLRGKLVFLHVKRRRWLNKQTNEVVQRDWNLVAKGTRMTSEFASFLKAFNQY